MTPNLMTIPAIFVIAGVGLLIVAIIGELSIKEIRVPPLQRNARILSAVAGIVFIGLGTSWPREARGSSDDPREEALFNSPAEGSSVPLKTAAAGRLRNALPAPVSYWLLLQDDDGDYYPIRRIAVQQNGAWEEPIKFGPAWKGRTAKILLVQTTAEDSLLSAATDSGEALHTLPVGLRTLITRKLRVQTP